MELIDRIRQTDFWQVIDLPDGSHTKGRVDHRRQPDILGLSSGFLKDKSVLDVAANDGFWSFYAEAQGASRVKAIDVETFEAYDWGHAGIPEKWRGKSAKNEAFDLLKAYFGSTVDREARSVYDLDPADGTFDVTICFGLLYHLRHPLLAIDRMRQVTTGTIVIQTHVVDLEPAALPACLFYGDDVLDNSDTNWTGPSVSCVVHWLRDAGFPHVFVGNKGYFVGCTNAADADHFRSVPRLRYCGEEYYAAARAEIESVLIRDRSTERVGKLRRIARRVFGIGGS